MAIVFFSSLEQGEVLEVAFLKPQGGQVSLRLLVDSGFTGQSCFVLPEDENDLVHAPAPASQAAGAL
jgi:predicted aspartyl protease